ncbi:tRNA (N6-threonylcarbamoyladenosine(37)-N6)-methyltransferase TrmO [Myxococcota bacterium]|nr:tRNA (N6-threonylcarbamoyladenosine(37)-N6)-methyltransferase TrmO [Myxococcota bacterium]
MSFTYEPIGFIQSPFKSKFGVPRQPGLVESTALLRIDPPWDDPLAFRDIEGFSHLWILFHFHEVQPREKWSPLVRPPRLGGNNRVGVFASRSPYRPNSLGLSLVGNGGVSRSGNQTILTLLGGDFVDGTPVLDIKPYLPYAEALTGARGGYAPTPPPATLPIHFEPRALLALETIEPSLPGFTTLLKQMLALDPRPQYHSDSPDHHYGLPLYDYNVRWRVDQGAIHVAEIESHEAFLARKSTPDSRE